MVEDSTTGARQDASGHVLVRPQGRAAVCEVRVYR